MSVDGLPRAFASWKRGTREDAEVEAGCASTKSSGWRSGGWTYMHERERCVPSVESSDGIRTYKFPCFVRSQRPCRVGPVCLPGSLMGGEMELIGYDRIEIATQRNWLIVSHCTRAERGREEIQTNRIERGADRHFSLLGLGPAQLFVRLLSALVSIVAWIDFDQRH